YLYFLLCLVAIMVGCNSNLDEEKEAQLSMISKTNPTPINLSSQPNQSNTTSKKIKEEVESIDSIYDVAVIKGKDKILVAYKVKHLRRFHMKTIEKEVNDKLEKKFPDEDFTVSSDYKIFLEAVRLGEKLKDPSYPDKKAKKELERIIGLSKELK
ncbi:MAG TPA: YhcN/YlaJ family sporulation lipoprotein, partial [Bacillus sp. (in: firmicutes)]|nr:YhcN/YlaJ family sporulation lipoprotein [Bacillus sp. (in: firmicutes)]